MARYSGGSSVILGALTSAVSVLPLTDAAEVVSGSKLSSEGVRQREARLPFQPASWQRRPASHPIQGLLLALPAVSKAVPSAPDCCRQGVWAAGGSGRRRLPPTTHLIGSAAQQFSC